MLFISLSKIQKKLVDNVRERRLQMNLTQEGLAERSGIPLPTLRKFEQKEERIATPAERLSSSLEV